MLPHVKKCVWVQIPSTVWANEMGLRMTALKKTTKILSPSAYSHFYFYPLHFTDLQLLETWGTHLILNSQKQAIVKRKQIFVAIVKLKKVYGKPVSTCVFTCVCSAHVCVCGKRLTIGVFLNCSRFHILRQGLWLQIQLWSANLLWKFFLYFLLSGYRQPSRATQHLCAL